jgi:hypothetical protein
MTKIKQINLNKTKFAVCKKCAFYLNEQEEGCDIWYHNYCGAVELDVERDPLDGEMKHVIYNSLGDKLFMEDITKSITNCLPYEFCKKVNPKEECPHFKEKENELHTLFSGAKGKTKKFTQFFTNFKRKTNEQEKEKNYS